MTLGLAETQGDLFDDVTRFCAEALSEGSVYAMLARERDRLFPDGMFADLFSDRGRRSVPPSVVATVMVGTNHLDAHRHPRRFVAGPGAFSALNSTLYRSTLYRSALSSSTLYKRRTLCYSGRMAREITQRELRNESGKIMSEVDEGKTFIVTRNGVPVGELTPLHRNRFLRAETVVALFRTAPALDYKRFRTDLDAAADQDAMPRA